MTATQTRELRLTIQVDPIVYAEAAGVEVWQAADHAREWVARRLEALNGAGGWHEGLEVRPAEPRLV